MSISNVTTSNTNYSKTREFDQAIEVAKSRKNGEAQVFSLLQIAKDMGEANEMDRATQVIHTTIEIVKNMKFAVNRGSALGAIAVTTLKLGKKDRAIEIMNTAIQINKNLKAEKRNSPILKESISDNLLKMGAIDPDIDMITTNGCLDSIRDAKPPAKIQSDEADEKSITDKTSETLKEIGKETMTLFIPEDDNEFMAWLENEERYNRSMGMQDLDNSA